MPAKRTLGSLLAAIALLTMAWLLLDREEVAVPPAANAAPQPDAAPAANAAKAEVAGVGSGSPAALATERSELAAADAQFAVLRGRCVDVDGTPLAGCTVQLRGRVDEARLAKWLLDNDLGLPPPWQDPTPATTGTDGRFRFAFWPPPPLSYSLSIKHDGRAPLNTFFTVLEEGTERDLGDVVLQPGVRVTGRVVDENGAPEPKLDVSLFRQDRRSAVAGVLRPIVSGQAIVKADGTFALHALLAPGEYEVQAQGRELVSPTTLTLVAERPEEVLTIVVRPSAAMATITGRIVDETGAPAPDVRVEDRSAHGSASARSRRDGTFELRQKADAADSEALLMLDSDAFDVVDKKVRPTAWGTRDVEFQVVRAGSLTLRVTDAASAPIERYTVWLLPHNRGSWSSRDSRARAQGQHADGTVTIAGLVRGDWLLVVDFPAPTGLQPLFETFRQDVIGPRRLDLRAVAAAVRTLRVLAADDSPVAGSKVQLCELFGQPLDDQRLVLRRDLWLTNLAQERHAMVVCEGETAADGRLELRGPGGRDLGLCLLGPGHVPLRQVGVRLDAGGELVVRVRRGARLVGKVKPPEALAELKQLAGVDPAAAFPPAFRPRLELLGDAGSPLPNTLTATEDLQRLLLGDDGSFDVDGLPPGTWRVGVMAWILVERSGIGRQFAAGAVSLADGETTHQDLDLRSVLRGTLEGTVLCNGQPFADGIVTLQGERDGENQHTDAAGGFTCRLFPGDYELRVQRQAQDGSWLELPCPARVHMLSGATVRQTFAATSGRLRVTLRNADGRPVAGAKVSVLAGERSAWLPATAADGSSEGEFATGGLVLRVLPQRLSTQEAQLQLAREAMASGSRFELPWIPLATVTLSPGMPQDLELKLPADSGY